MAKHGYGTQLPLARPEPEVWRPVFLSALRELGVVAYAAEAAGVNRRTAYRHRAEDPAFALEWADAVEEAVDKLEVEAHRRAVTGVKRMEYYKGEVVGEYREYSDTLLVFLLKAHRPERFRDRYDVTSGGQTVNLQQINVIEVVRPAGELVEGEVIEGE